MRTNRTFIRTAAILGTFMSLQGCTHPDADVAYDPRDKYPVGHVYDCGREWSDMRLNTENSNYSGFGCAHQSNLSAMVADPLDLERQRDITPPDPEQRQRVLEKYREGKKTQTATKAQGTQKLIK